MTRAELETRCANLIHESSALLLERDKLKDELAVLKEEYTSIAEGIRMNCPNDLNILVRKASMMIRMDGKDTPEDALARELDDLAARAIEAAGETNRAYPPSALSMRLLRTMRATFNFAAMAHELIKPFALPPDAPMEPYLLREALPKGSPSSSVALRDERAASRNPETFAAELNAAFAAATAKILDERRA